MGVYEQVFIKPGVYDVDGEQFALPEDEIREYVDGTKRMMAGGLSIPIVYVHADDDWAGPQDSEDDARNNAGWVREVRQDGDGSAISKLEITDPEVEEKLKNGSIRFTSPQFVDGFRDGKGRDWGKVIRHMALTHKPRNPDQGPFKAVRFSLSLANRVINMAKKSSGGKHKSAGGKSPQAKAMWAKVSEAGGARDSKSRKYVSGTMEGEWSEDDITAQFSDDEKNEYGGLDDAMKAAFMLKKGYKLADEMDADPEEEEDGDEEESAPKNFSPAAILPLVTAIGSKLGADMSEADESEEGLMKALNAISDKIGGSDESEEEEEKETVPAPQFSESPQAKATAAYVNNKYREEVASRLEAVVKSGRCTADEFKAKNSTVNAVSFSLASDGKPAKDDLVKWIESRESCPVGTFWSADERSTKSAAFSESVPSPSPAPGAPLTPEEIAKRAAFVRGR